MMKNIIQVKKSILKILLLFAFVIGISACNHQSKQDENKSIVEENEASFNKVATKKDSLFLVNVTQINLEEIKLGMLAQQISMTHDIEELGKIMEVDYTKFLNDITYLAVKKQIAIPTISTKELKNEYKKLSKKAGGDFDLAYSTMMVDKIRATIFVFDAASNKADDADIKAWATASLPNLRAQLDKAMSCLDNANNEIAKR
jgi:putative membrane protein